MVLKQQWICIIVILAGLVGGRAVAAISLQPSVFDEGLEKLRAEYTTRMFEERGFDLSGEQEGDNHTGTGTGRTGHKSPAKAFALSLAVPGLGQYYYGSRVKPFLFLGAEIGTWVLHLKWHGDADDMTTEFQDMADSYWREERYTYFLTGVYGIGDDDSLSGFTEIGHHLPDSRTQQYYEMIGKYDQFSWGWTDAYLGHPDSTLYNSDLHAVTGPSMTPTSDLREQYETLRDDANQRYDRANKMIVVAIVNRLFSAFEAYIVTRSNNKKVPGAGEEFGSIRVRAALKSYSVLHDTPFLKVSYSF